MTKNEQSAVETLLNEINSLKIKVEALEKTIWIYSPMTYREAVTTYRPPDITYAVTDDNVIIPLTWTSWYYGWTTYCTRTNN